jgi:hypothetical protein
MTNTGYILVEIVTESTSGDDEYYDQEYEVKNTIAHSNNKEELEEEAESLNRNYQKINDKIVGLNKYIQDYNSKFEIELVNFTQHIAFDASLLLDSPDYVPRTAQEHKFRKEIKDFNQNVKNEFEAEKEKKISDFTNNYKLKNPISEKLKDIVKLSTHPSLFGYQILFLKIEVKTIRYAVEEFAKSYVENTCEKLKAIWD